MIDTHRQAVKRLGREDHQPPCPENGACGGQPALGLDTNRLARGLDNDTSETNNHSGLLTIPRRLSTACIAKASPILYGSCL
jgi:hypothetical protein